MTNASITPCGIHEQITDWENQDHVARAARECADCRVEDATA